MSTRKRKKRRLHTRRKQSPLGLLCLNNSSKFQMSFLLKTASTHEIVALNASKTSPLCQALLRCASTNTKKGCKPRALMLCCNIIQTCIDCGIDLSLGMPITGQRWALPIVIAARFSMVPVVKLLLNAGVPPEVADSEGITPFHSAFSNPSSGTGATLRDIDVECIQLFFDRKLVTSNRTEFLTTVPGSCLDINVECIGRQTVLYGSIVHKNYQTAVIMVNQGARLTDNNFLMLYADRKSRRETTRLLPVCEHVAAAQNKRLSISKNVIDTQSAHFYDRAISWSFPPKWYRGVFQALMCWERTGLPKEVFLHHMVPCFARVHFFHDIHTLTEAPNLARVRPNFNE